MKDNSLNFSVDAGIINKLGIQLVGRSETAVSELIKNSYDADATIVDILFENSNIEGGRLIIDDNGEGMDIEALTKGFMRLSSTDKIHNPISNKFKRKRAGKKGIGRFSTQRLGSHLIILTKKKEMAQAIKLTINWDDYGIDKDLSSIQNKWEYVEPEKEEGTRLIISNLREAWRDVEIRRVYRYVSELIQPDYISDRTDKLNIAKQSGENSFDVQFIQKVGEEEEVIAAPSKLVFDKAVAIVEAYIDEVGDGYCSIYSDKLKINDFAERINANQKQSDSKFKYAKNIHFKSYYFIYNRPDYYNFDNSFTRLEYNSIAKMAAESSGIKLYRNGFRVLPYGERGDDWLDIERNASNVRSMTKSTNLPLGRKNFFGFVEIIDNSNDLFTPFEETANREGLIENKAFRELQDFLQKVIAYTLFRIAAAEEFIRLKQERDKKSEEHNDEQPLESLRKDVEKIQEKLESDDPDKNEVVKSLLSDLDETLDQAESKINKKIEERIREKVRETEMLRILASIGLVIGEFVHEIEQFDTTFQNSIFRLKQTIPEVDDLTESLSTLESHFLSYKTYSAYFRSSVSNNVQREIKPINLKDEINKFLKQIKNDSEKSSIQIEKKYLKRKLITAPMHPSEWLSILFNLYVNAKKAIKRSSQTERKILIKVNSKNDRILLSFQDNGDGIGENIKDHIFLPFFTTATPLNYETKDIDDNSGSGLGLYIVKNIIESRNGSIEVSRDVDEGYVTCLRIELPINKDNYERK